MLACVQAIEVAKEKEAEKEKLLEQLKAKVEVGIDQLRASVDRCVALEEALRDVLTKQGLGDAELPDSFNAKAFYAPLPIEHDVQLEFDADNMPDDASIEQQLEAHLRRLIHSLDAQVLTLPLPSPLLLPPTPNPTLTLTLTLTPTLTLTLTLTLTPTRTLTLTRWYWPTQASPSTSSPLPGVLYGDL